MYARPVVHRYTQVPEKSEQSTDGTGARASLCVCVCVHLPSFFFFLKLRRLSLFFSGSCCCGCSFLRGFALVSRFRLPSPFLSFICQRASPLPGFLFSFILVVLLCICVTVLHFFFLIISNMIIGEKGLRNGTGVCVCICVCAAVFCLLFVPDLRITMLYPTRSSVLVVCRAGFFLSFSFLVYEGRCPEEGSPKEKGVYGGVFRGLLAAKTKNECTRDRSGKAERKKAK
jgi:hypothetical protein